MTEQRIAVVTGGAKGIGRAIVKALAAEGMGVVIHCRHSAGQAEALAAEIQAAGGTAAVYPCDVADAAAVEAMFGWIMETFGRVDVLVNNAGLTRDGLLMRMGEEDWDAVLDANLKGAFLCGKQAAKIMIKQRRGRIIQISSVSGILGNAGQANYSASKAGLIGLTKSMARELASRHITVNAVAPGFIDTDMTAGLSPKVREAAQGQIPLGAFGKPEDVAAAVAFLASEKAGYITGQVLSVDGGMAM